MNFVTLGQLNYGVFTGPQLNAAVVAQGPAWLNSAYVSQTNIGFASASQTNVAIIGQGH
jgi:hypothetical protein